MNYSDKFIVTYFLFLFLSSSFYSGTNSFLFSSNNKKVGMKKVNGFDERYPTNGTFVNSTELAMFNIHWNQLKLLRLLQNNAVSIYSKIHLIDHYDILSSTRSIYAPNLYAGGLLTDWDKDLE
jgi:hypothetical protein